MNPNLTYDENMFIKTWLYRASAKKGVRQGRSIYFALDIFQCMVEIKIWA